MNKTVSIIMPVFNGEEYLAECIESILNQTYDDLEFVIANDGSTDNSLKIIANYMKFDKRIKLIDKPNSGVADSLNVCIKQSIGRYISRMDADDIAFPKRLEKQIECLDNTEADICYTYVEIFGDISDSEKAFLENRHNFDILTYEILLENNHLCAHPTIMFNRLSLFNLGLYNANVICEDWDLWFRALKNGAVFKSVPEKLLKFRKHATSITAAKRFFYVEQIKIRKLDAAKDYFQENPKYPIWHNGDTAEYAIWGAGNGGKILYECMKQKNWGWNLSFFIDTYKKGSFMEEKIIAPDEINEDTPEFIFIALKEGKLEAVEMLKKLGKVMFRDFMCI